jgi:hypothetical protein
MKVKLTKYNRIEKGKAGVVVDVTPARARFLIEFGLAEPAPIREQIEVPERKANMRKSTRK